MSVINQVLNQLEQRGAQATVEQPMVRAVRRSRNLTVPLIATGLVLVAGVAAWLWLPAFKTPAGAGSVAPKAAISPDTFEHEESKSPQQTAATETAPGSPVEAGVPAGDTSAGPLAAASRLSLELSLPPPSTLQPDSERAASPFATSRGSEKSPRRNDRAAIPHPAARRKTGKPVSPEPLPSTNAGVAVQTPAGVAPMKQISSAQRADAEFHRAASMAQQGHIAEAITGYEAALRLDAGHEAARQALVALLLESKRNEDAEKVLLEGLKIKPGQAGFTMLLARLQVERGALEQATATLELSLPFADAQADYRAFLAALLQRQNRNEEAISQYQIVLQQAPDNGVWLMGYAISLQALHRDAEAKDAFQRALATQRLSPELQAFVQQRLKGL